MVELTSTAGAQGAALGTGVQVTGLTKVFRMRGRSVTALQDAARDVLAGGVLPEGTRALN